MNLNDLRLANELRREAYLDNDPLLHAAADSVMSRLVHAHQDADMLRRAQERAARAVVSDPVVSS